MNEKDPPTTCLWLSNFVLHFLTLKYYLRRQECQLTPVMAYIVKLMYQYLTESSPQISHDYSIVDMLHVRESVGRTHRKDRLKW